MDGYIGRVPLQPPPMDSEGMDLAAAAERLGVHYQTAYQWVRDGSLPAARLQGRYRIDPAALEVFARRRAQPQPVPSRAKPMHWDRLAERFERHLLSGEETAARTLVLDLRHRNVPSTEVINQLLVPALRSIGEGWVVGTVGVPEEHRASAIVERLLGELSSSPRGRPRGKAIVAALSGDHHSLPTAMAAAALREDRWHVDHLGSDVPPGELLRFARETGADVVVLSVTNPAQAAAAHRTRRRLEQAGTPTLVGSPGQTLDELLEQARAESPAARKTSGALRT
jgi:excisionase family DNA binding protein